MALGKLKPKKEQKKTEAQRKASRDVLAKLDSRRFYIFTCHTDCFSTKKYNIDDIVTSTERSLGHALCYFEKGEEVQPIPLAKDAVLPTQEQVDAFLAKQEADAKAAKDEENAAKKAAAEAGKK